MQKITNDNAKGLCQEEYCSKQHTRFTNITLRGMKLHLSFCDKHAEQWEEFYES